MKNQTAPSTKLMVVLIGLFWGLNWPAVKFLLLEIPPLSLRAFSFTCAAVLLMAMSRVLGLRLRPTKGEGFALIVTAVFLLFGFNMFTAFGQLFTQASNAAIIAYTMPAMTAVLSAFVLGDTIDKRRILAICVGLVGLGVLAAADVPAIKAAPLGPVFMLLAAFSWSIGNVLMQVHEWTLSPLVRAAWFFVISASLTWPFVFVFEPLQELVPPSPATVWVLLFHILGPMVACYMMWTTLLGHLSATVAAISTLLAPVVGVLSAVILLGEPMTWQKALALFLIVASIAIAIFRKSSVLEAPD
ncbi:MAG: DMT family transporter [Pseudomonadota bacterium]|uniref:DMT family transporter n=1 Tax=Roseovarius sp. TaxID=1486281 RepID=UPI0035658039